MLKTHVRHYDRRSFCSMSADWFTAFLAHCSQPCKQSRSIAAGCRSSSSFCDSPAQPRSCTRLASGHKSHGRQSKGFCECHAYAYVVIADRISITDCSMRSGHRRSSRPG